MAHHWEHQGSVPGSSGSSNCWYYRLHRHIHRLLQPEPLPGGFYAENDFVDYYFHVVRAPQQIIRQVEAIPGVEKVTGRIQKDVSILKEDHQRATARLISYPLPVDNEINRFRLEKGRLLRNIPRVGGIEVLVDPKYLTPTSTLSTMRSVSWPKGSRSF